MPAAGPLRLGISSCLLGNEVRYDGGHKRNRFLTDVLGPFVEWVPVCPEVEVGMGVPRESVRLVRGRDGVRMLAEHSGSDWTVRMRRTSRARVRALAKLDLAGYVLKQDSPSCGFERVRVYNAKGVPKRKGRGVFATELIEADPLLPVEDEGRLQDPVLRENFIERVFAYRRLRDLFKERFSVGRLVGFHLAHELQLMAHAPKAYDELHRLVGGARKHRPAELRRRYADGFMTALARPATTRRHVKVLHHLVGFFKKDLSAPARRELLGLIEDYRGGRVPLVAPLTRVRHHAAALEVATLAGQHYLEPHPRELMLRNLV